MPPLTLKHLEQLTPQDFAAARVWAGCYDREYDLWEMAEDGYSEAEIADAVRPFEGFWPDEDFFFPIVETGIDRQQRTRGLLIAAEVHLADGRALPGFVWHDDDSGQEWPSAFFQGHAWSLSVDTAYGIAEFRKFMKAVGQFARTPLVIETLVTDRRWTVGLR